MIISVEHIQSLAALEWNFRETVGMKNNFFLEPWVHSVYNLDFARLLA